ncbi:hypothetical protein MKW92_041061 [Papaver armeniacum]|nr:hypothetical protein MKW92_041061 [Papaver armeniacum]
MAENMQKNTTTTTRRVSRVGIIGAGISGIAAAKQLKRYNPVVFEGSDSLGGVWQHCSYRSTKLQTPRYDYEFSDYPWPERDNHNFPSSTEIVDYVYNYAKHFDVLKYVEFNTKVVELRYVGGRDTMTTDLLVEDDDVSTLCTGKPLWEVAVKSKYSEIIEWYSFEFLVVCIGKYGDVPKMPEFPTNKGPENFNGKVLHTLDYCKLNKDETTELLQGKKVVVIGYKKSAIDLATECAEANQGPDGKPCTMVIRTLHWTVPSYSIWGLPFFLFYSTRFSQFLHERPNQSLLKDLFTRFASPMRKGVSKFIESYLEWKLPLAKYGLKPSHPFEEDYASCQMAILPENFFKQADEGRILFKKSPKWSFWSGGIEFEDKTKLEADVVVLATGFDGKGKLKSLFPEPFRSLLEDSTGIMPLYRGTIHPLIPGVAFVGYTESVSNLHSSEIRCKWLSRALDGRFKLPTVENMLEQVSKEIEVSKRSTRFYKKKPCISTFSINHTDEICEEMGLKSWRKKNWFLEAFSPYNNRDYEEEK